MAKSNSAPQRRYEVSLHNEDACVHPPLGECESDAGAIIAAPTQAYINVGQWALNYRSVGGVWNIGTGRSIVIREIFWVQARTLFKHVR